MYRTAAVTSLVALIFLAWSPLAKGQEPVPDPPTGSETGKQDFQDSEPDTQGSSIFRESDKASFHLILGPTFIFVPDEGVPIPFLDLRFGIDFDFAEVGPGLGTLIFINYVYGFARAKLPFAGFEPFIEVQAGLTVPYPLFSAAAGVGVRILYGTWYYLEMALDLRYISSLDDDESLTYGGRFHLGFEF